MLLPTPMLIEIISNEELDVKTEENVFKAVMSWVRHDLETRQVEMAKVRIPARPSTFTGPRTRPSPPMHLEIPSQHR